MVFQQNYVYQKMTCEHEHEQSQYIIIFLELQEIGGWLMSILGIPRFVILDNVMI